MKKIVLLFPLLLILASGCFRGMPEYELAPPPEFRMHDKAVLAGASIADDDVLMIEDLSSGNDTKHITFSGLKIYIDAGNVTSPASTNGDFARYDGATGLLLKDGIALEQTLSSPGDNVTIPTSNAVRLSFAAPGAIGGTTPGAGSFTIIDTNATIFTFTADGNLTDPLVRSVYLLNGDNDGNNETISLLDGEKSGQRLYLIANSDIDANDILTIGMTHTTCTNCPTIIFNKVGENAQLMWTGSTWVVTSPVQDAL